ncbi:hypothetical protein CHS0354_038245, partial [Potamilus streckersoni]
GSLLAQLDMIRPKGTSIAVAVNTSHRNTTATTNNKTRGRLLMLPAQRGAFSPPDSLFPCCLSRGARSVLACALSWECQRSKVKQVV